MDFVNVELAGYKLLFSLLLPESFYIYNLRFHPKAVLRYCSFCLTTQKKVNITRYVEEDIAYIVSRLHFFPL